MHDALDKKQTHSVHGVLEQSVENGGGNGNGRPSKLERKPSYGEEQKPSDLNTIDETGESDEDEEEEADALEQYRFIRLIRSQLLQAKPFSNVEEYNANVLKTKKFKKTYDSMNYHYRQLMTILDNLSTDARSITETYRENV